MKPMYALSREFAALADAESEEWIDPETGEVRDAAVVLAGLKLDMAEKAQGIAAVLAQMKGTAAMLKEEEARLSKRRAAVESARERLLAYLADSMTAAGVKKLEAGSFSIGLRAGPERVVVVAAEKIPADFLVPQPPRPDVAGAKACMKQHGYLPPGFDVEPGKPYIVIK